VKNEERGGEAFLWRERMVVYKVVETSTVTEDILEQILNEWVPQGWQFDSIQFVVRDASKRPAMAFLFFVRETDEEKG
jgi:hypothetical protein